MKNLEVTAVNPQEDNIVKVLGVSDEKFDQIAKLLSKGIASEALISTMMNEVSQICDNPNELALACFKMADTIGKLNQVMSNPFAMLAEMMGGGR